MEGTNDDAMDIDHDVGSSGESTGKSFIYVKMQKNSFQNISPDSLIVQNSPATFSIFHSLCRQQYHHQGAIQSVERPKPKNQSFGNASRNIGTYSG